MSESMAFYTYLLYCHRGGDVKAASSLRSIKFYKPGILLTCGCVVPPSFNSFPQFALLLFRGVLVVEHLESLRRLTQCNSYRITMLVCAPLLSVSCPSFWVRS